MPEGQDDDGLAGRSETARVGAAKPTPCRDHEAYLQRFLPIQTALRGYLLAVTRDPSETDDLLQEIAAVLWQKFAEFDAERSFSAWAMGIAKIQILRRRRSQARSRQVFSDQAVESLAVAAAAESEIAHARHVHLAACLDKLPVHHRAIIDLRFGKSQPVAEVATQVNKTVAAVEMMLVRIRRWLHDCMERAAMIEHGRAP